MICYITEKKKLKRSWKFIKPRCNSGRRSTFAGNRALRPSDVIDFAMLSAHRFWRETVFIVKLMSRNLEVTNESVRGKERISNDITLQTV